MTRSSPCAVVRGLSPSLSRCELTHIERVPIDLDRAAREHRNYVQVLRDAELTVVELAADEAHPDCVFIEDLLLELDGVRILTHPGAPARRGERDGVRAAFAAELADWGPLLEMPEDAHLDGGDVLAVRDRVYVGRSSRTDEAGIRWLAAQVERPVVPIPVPGTLHLKSAVTSLAEGLLILNPSALNPAPFRCFDLVLTTAGEEAAANCLRLPPRPMHATVDVRDERVLMPASCEVAIDVVRRWGIEVIPVPMVELARAEAGLTCMSVLLGANFSRLWR